MILKLREKEIIVSKEEAEKIGEALMEGTEFFRIGDEIVNSKYVIGIFEGYRPEPQYDRLLVTPKPEKADLKRIGLLLEEMREELKEKKILKL